MRDFRYDSEAEPNMLAPRQRPTPDLLAAARPFDLADWLSSGVLQDARADGLEVHLSIKGTTYEAYVTVWQVRALSAAIAKAEGQP